MKELMLYLLLSASMMPFQSESCPTCQGRIEKESPPFFTDEFYKPSAESMDYIYQQLLAEQEQQASGTTEVDS